MSVYRSFVPGYNLNMSCTTPSISEVFVPQITVARAAEEIDTTESGSGDGSSGQAGYGDTFTGVKEAEVTFDIQVRSGSTLITDLDVGVEMQTVTLAMDRAKTSGKVWSFPSLIITKAPVATQVKNGVWKISITAKTRGPYTIPATAP